uniref:Uncharacterized protein n=1 Tax=Ananas comosus var. bracteatus TaxID=296719 RepID=A0A6V7NYY3_ANACO|nr:unnamed protein product [Ananas comosus var. bracteatus]
MAMPATAREGMGAAEDPRPRQWNGREVACLVPDEVGVRQRNSGTRKQTGSGARPRGVSDGQRRAAGVVPNFRCARPRGGSGGERRAAGVPNFRCSASRGVPMASGARPGARRVLKNPIFDVERCGLPMAIGERPEGNGGGGMGRRQGREARDFERNPRSPYLPDFVESVVLARLPDLEGVDRPAGGAAAWAPSGLTVARFAVLASDCAEGTLFVVFRLVRVVTGLRLELESLFELDRDTLHTRLGSSHECHSGGGRGAFALVSLRLVGLAIHGLVSVEVAIQSQLAGTGVFTVPGTEPQVSATAPSADQDRGKGVASAVGTRSSLECIYARAEMPSLILQQSLSCSGLSGAVGVDGGPMFLLLVSDCAEGIGLIELDRDTLHTRLGSSHECHSGDGRYTFALVSFV